VFQLLLASQKSSQELAGKCRIPTVISEVKIDALEVRPQPVIPETVGATPEQAPTNGDQNQPQTLLEREAEPGPSASSQDLGSVSKTGASSTETILR
jgi:hypothetical protein